MTEVKSEIHSTLTGDSTYLDLLDNPGSEPYQTFYIEPPERPTFPEVVFWFSPEVFNEEIGAELLESECTLHFNAWARTEVYERIAERIIQLLHQQPNDSYGFRAILDNEPEEMYDDDFNVYGVTLNFLVYFRRAKI